MQPGKSMKTIIKSNIGFDLFMARITSCVSRLPVSSGGEIPFRRRSLLGPLSWLLSIIEHRVHHHFFLFNCARDREWESPYGAAAKIPVSNRAHFRMDTNVLHGRIDTIKTIETKALPLSFIPGTGQFQIVS